MDFKALKNKVVLVTGGTGSFGRKFVELILTNSECKKVIVFSRDEFKQYHMERELKDKRLRFFIGDVRDLSRLERAFAGVDVVVHAAALKQVPALEYNPMEAVKTNIIGSQNVIDAAIDSGVKKALLISTDKAAHPVNLYGSTKLAAEKLFIAGNSYSPKKTIFSVVRYGNVIGSRGSIVETLIKNPGAKKVLVTDLAMTRFWIDLKGATDLVGFALTNMEGGEIFVPKIPSMKLVDLFDALAPKAEKEVIGIRSGEKIHEVLLTSEEANWALEIGGYFVVLPQYHFWSDGLYKKYERAGKKLPAGFSFTSNANSEWLTKENLKGLLKRDPGV